MRTFHHSTLDSPRIKKLLAFLEARGEQGATTIEITTACTTTRASSDVSELNACLRGTVRYVEAKYEGENDNKKRIHRYFLRKNESTEKLFSSAFKAIKNMVEKAPEQAAAVQPEIWDQGDFA